MSRKPMIQMPTKDLQSLLVGTGISRAEIAKKLDISVFTINKWVSEGRLPSEYIDKLMSLQQRMVFTFEEKKGQRTAMFGPQTAKRIKQSDLDIGFNSKKSLGLFNDSELVDELERRGWMVTLNRASQSKKKKD